MLNEQVTQIWMIGLHFLRFQYSFWFRFLSNIIFTLRWNCTAFDSFCLSFFFLMRSITTTSSARRLSLKHLIILVRSTCCWPHTRHLIFFRMPHFWILFTIFSLSNISNESNNWIGFWTFIHRPNWIVLAIFFFNFNSLLWFTLVLLHT